MKKLLCVLLIIACLPFQATALNSEKQTVDRHAIELTVEKSMKIAPDVVFTEDGVDYLLEKFKYEQSMEVQRNGQQSFIAEYTDVITPRASGSGSMSDWDKSLSAYFTVTVYYTTSTKNNAPYIKYDRATGSFSITDQSVSMKSQTVRLGQHGVYVDSNGIYQGSNEDIVRNPTTSSWSYTFSWPAILDNEQRDQYAAWDYTLGRSTGTNTWGGTIGIAVAN